MQSELATVDKLADSTCDLIEQKKKVERCPVVLRNTSKFSF